MGDVGHHAFQNHINLVSCHLTRSLPSTWSLHSHDLLTIFQVLRHEQEGIEGYILLRSWILQRYVYKEKVYRIKTKEMSMKESIEYRAFVIEVRG